MTPRRPILLVGAGSFAEEVTDVLRMSGVPVAGWIEGLDPGRVDRSHDPPIVWINDVAKFEAGLAIVPAIGSVKRRGIIELLLAQGRQLATVQHPSAVVAPTAVIEGGCVLFPGAIIGARSRIGVATIVNRGALIGHHSTIGAFSFVGPGANIAGLVSIGEQVHVAVGAVVRDRIRVGAGATIGAGAVVVSDVEAGTTVIGVPARPINRE